MFAAPAPYPVPEPVVAECVSTASRTYAVPELVIRTILKVEGGKVGTMSRNTNGSYDLGPMQINTINLSLINKEYPFLTWKHITYNPCINIMVGTWFLSSKIRARKGVIWEGVGEMWMLCEERFRKYGKSMTRAALAYTDCTVIAGNLHRLQITVRCADLRAVRWAMVLGFEIEGMMKRYGPDQSDFYLMSKT